MNNEYAMRNCFIAVIILNTIFTLLLMGNFEQKFKALSEKIDKIERTLEQGK